MTQVVGITIGTFDGVHLGHKAVIQALVERVDIPIAITFANHPATLLGHTSPYLLCSLERRLQLLKKIGIKRVITLPFTQALSQLSAEAFLLAMRQQTPFSYLVLGHDAAIGHNREGNKKRLELLSKKFNFVNLSIPPVMIEGEIVSSSAIRQALKKGDLEKAQKLLGRVEN